MCVYTLSICLTALRIWGKFLTGVWVLGVGAVCAHVIVEGEGLRGDYCSEVQNELKVHTL